ncbi:MAG: DUF3800 domain-containing protein [Ignavibacteriae bacterium]|nr:MAG: DUF3800 domain-containing protein [Ignavibacteriota bacterium]
MNYKLFIDESGDHGLTTINNEFPVFVLCGMLVEDYEDLRLSINEIKEHFWHGKKVIFHSRDIRKCEKEFKILLDLGVKKEFFTKLDKFMSTKDYTLIASAIDKNEYFKKHGLLGNDVYEIALSFIFEKCLSILIKNYGDKFKLEIFIEKRGRKEDQELSEHFQRIKSRGTAFIEADFLKEHVSDIVFNDKKENINGLQISDLAAYPIARYIIDKDRANPAFEILKEKFYHWDEKDCSLMVYP